MQEEEEGPGSNGSFGHRHGLTVLLVLMGLAMVAVIVAQMV
jgi:hypothetical protein